MDIYFLIVGIVGVVVAIIIPLILKDWRKLKLNKDNGLYYYENGPQIPYCPNCYENKNKKIKLQNNTKTCPKCKKGYARNPVIHIVNINNKTKFHI